ncbi:ATP-binding cassette domain-containing protein [Jatrophihabitans telluris]|uniref:ATP-binding cassette domain-containing protein n=1 Tax=Jatrophihabitans telluris TaxID=2038343 RepID=A0ABY4QV73_9ACTN|nr:ATP-binding cassette domain-containing protein [Jatrophihabitans telluris]UQX86997.1 ATP-binding cassette domain-containing protein [Jatrophihabitans telluris]
MNEQTMIAPASTTMSLAGIGKNYDGVAALTGVDLEIRGGEVHALLGENGAGKSTLMGVASGAVAPDTGTITVGGQTYPRLTPVQATELKIAIVHQHPAVMPDLTVAENIRVAVAPQYLSADGGAEAAMRTMLEAVGFTRHLEDRVGSLTIAQKHLLELAKALAVGPALLILDEPTAPLGQDSVALLFDAVRAAAARGTAVVYITHRLAEVRELADRVTVLRDGSVRGSSLTSDISDDELLALIVGRKLASTFPAKPERDPQAEQLLSVQGLSGQGFDDVSFTASRGEIVGVSGIVGNGQSALLRALAGLEPSDGIVQIAGETFGAKKLRRRSGYLPADRHREGLMMSMSVRENAALSALGRFTRGPLLRSAPENEAVAHELSALAVKTGSPETLVSALSGGNQQKVVLARALMSQPAILVADEPTQGVDVGARAEIYRILRQISADGVPVVVASSDAKELEGLCDRVIVMSRGSVVQTCAGDDITEEALIHSAVRATGHSRGANAPASATASSRVRRFLTGDYAPVLVLALVMLLLGAYVLSKNSRYLGQFNVTSIMTSCAALGFIALGQTIVLLVGGIDLSVGPLAGFMVVVGSFFLTDGKSGIVMVLGLALMLACGVGNGVVNGTLIRYAKFTPVAATLATYIALQGLSFLLRSSPGGNIAGSVSNLITHKVGPFPLSFVVMAAATLVLEGILRFRRSGLRLRAVGSDEDSARKVGVAINPTVIAAYVGSSVMVFFGAVVLLAQLGIGDPSQGVSYTLSSITAVVLGGTSLLGGRGTFIGTLLGAGLIVQVLNATVFLNLTQTWQYFFQGALIVVAAVIYSQVRGFRRTTA